MRVIVLLAVLAVVLLAVPAQLEEGRIEGPLAPVLHASTHHTTSLHADALYAAHVGTTHTGVVR